LPDIGVGVVQAVEGGTEGHWRGYTRVVGSTRVK